MTQTAETTPETGQLTLRDVVAVLERMHPLDTAQSWDRVGLVAGDLDQPVSRIHLAVDPTLAVIEEARAAGADLIITHHPLLLRGIHSVATTTAKGVAVTELLVNDIALYCAHTNADVADPGVGQALADACGLTRTEALEITEGQELGRVGDLPAPTTLAEFARRLHENLPRTAGGIRVAGPADGAVRRVAVLGGAGDSSFDAVRAADADVYVTADLRHHPALEAREEASLTGGTPYLIDAGHFASESLWLPGLASRLMAELAGAAARLEVHVSQVRTDPWEFVLGASGPEQDPLSGPHTNDAGDLA
nr:Nif3-like dinuclear metal center hexameric protein [Ornithinimicrobium murale]